MIWYYIISFVDNFFSTILSVLHIPKIETLPFGVDSTLVLGFGYFHQVMYQLPFISIIFNAFLWYMTFRITLLILKNIPFFRINV